jgi:hypothetical protein
MSLKRHLVIYTMLECTNQPICLSAVSFPVSDGWFDTYCYKWNPATACTLPLAPHTWRPPRNAGLRA